MSLPANPEEAAIRKIVDGMESAWNRGDGYGFAADMVEDVDFIDVLGRHHQGREAVGVGHAQMFVSFYRGSRIHYQVEGVRFVRPDVALAFLHARLTHRLSVAVDNPDREVAPIGVEHEHDTNARPTLVLTKDGGRWQVVSSQNTVVAPPPGA